MSSTDAKPYTHISGLEDIYLEDSYVLAIREEPGSVAFTMEFVLTPQHPRFQPGRPGEQHCYRRGALAFSGVRDLRWTARHVRPGHDASGQADYGNIDSFTFTGTFHRLTGDWGELEFDADRVSVSLD